MPLLPNARTEIGHGPARKSEQRKALLSGLFTAAKIVIGMSIAGGAATFMIAQFPEDGLQWSFGFGKPAQTRRTSVFSEIIERDRQMLRGQQPRTINPLIKDLWSQMGSSPATSSGTASGPTVSLGAPVNLRGLFSEANPSDRKAVERAWSLAYIHSGVDFPLDQQRAATSAAPSRTTPPRAPTGFTEPQRGGASTASPDSPRGFTEVRAGEAHKRPSLDDLDFIHSILNLASRDFEMTPRAAIVLGELESRHPRAPELPLLKARLSELQAKHADALNERTKLEANTRMSTIRFTIDALVDLQKCFTAAGSVKSISGVAREVQHYPQRAAFLIVAQVAQVEAMTDEQQKSVAAEIGPCLTPLLQRGTVALALSTGGEDDVTRQRIENWRDSRLFTRDTAERL